MSSTVFLNSGCLCAEWSWITIKFYLNFYVYNRFMDLYLGICTLQYMYSTFYFYFSPFRFYILFSHNLPSWPFPANQHICYLRPWANWYTLLWWNRFVTIFCHFTSSKHLYNKVLTDLFFFFHLSCNRTPLSNLLYREESVGVNTAVWILPWCTEGVV